MKSAIETGIGLLLSLLIAGQLVAQELPELEPIPSPAADDGSAELPALEIPTPAEPEEDLQPIPETTPLTLGVPSGSDAEQVTYDEPIVEGPFSTIVPEADSDEGPALEPIADQSTYQDVTEDTPAIEFQSQPVHLPNDSGPSQTASIAPQSSASLVIEQPIIEQPVYSQPHYEQPVVTYQQPPVATQPQVIICPQNQSQKPAPQPQQRVVKPAPKVYYYRVDPRQTASARTQPQTVIVRQNVEPANRYYVAPQPQQQVQRAQYQQQVQRVPQQAPPAARPVNYEVQVTETTQYRPVQIRVTESYQTTPRPAAPRPTATIVVPSYVPFQPFRNAVRRRW